MEHLLILKMLHHLTHAGKYVLIFFEQGGLNFCLSFSYNPKTKVCKPSEFNSKYVEYYKKPCNTDPNDWEYSEWTPKSSKPGIYL